jgi:hypothetical protein
VGPRDREIKMSTESGSPESSHDPRLVPMPLQTQIVGPDDEILAVIDGVLLLPVGARLGLTETLDVTVIGTRFVVGDIGVPRLVLEVEIGSPFLELAAIEEADAEAQVVAEAEEITGTEVTATEVELTGAEATEPG